MLCSNFWNSFNGGQNHFPSLEAAHVAAFELGLQPGSDNPGKTLEVPPGRPKAVTGEPRQISLSSKFCRGAHQVKIYV